MDTEENIIKNEELTENFISFFSSMVGNLKIQYDEKQANLPTQPDPVLWMIEAFKDHSNILKIKEFMTEKGMSFFSSCTTPEKNYKALQNSDKKKACQKMTSLRK